MAKNKTDGQPPKFTKTEETSNAVTHLLGGVFGIVVLVLGVIAAALFGGWTEIASMAVFGVSIIVLYTISSVYHFLRPGKAKRVLRILDHCMIYLLIAGTYTPYCLIVMKGITAGYIILGCVWGFSALGIALNSWDMYKKWVKIYSYCSYLALGWCIIFAFKPLTENLATTPFWLLTAGGLAYTVGVIFYALDKKVKNFHAIWHLFVLAGTALHFASLLIVILP